jgi:DNA-binding NarL/FixJ family response regulator
LDGEPPYLLIPEERLKEDPMKKRIRVLPVDDHPVVLEGIRACLHGCEQFEVVGTVRSGEEAVAQAHQLSPDVFLMDVKMNGMDGLETTRKLRETYPHGRVLMFAGPDSNDLVPDMVRSGAKGWIRKNVSIGELISAIERVHRGETVVSPDIAQTFFKSFVQQGGQTQAPAKRVSERERQVLRLIVNGDANRRIAESLNISIRTVEKHRQRIMRKFHVHKATELVRFAITEGLVNLANVF